MSIEFAGGPDGGGLQSPIPFRAVELRLPPCL